MFISNYDEGSRYTTIIPLDASTSSGRDVHVEDIDAALSVDGPESRRALELKLSDIPAYDAARTERGDAAAIRDALPAAADGESPWCRWWATTCRARRLFSTR